jgi:hypothetical protein
MKTVFVHCESALHAIALSLCAAICIWTAAARADVLQTYYFLGELSLTYPGNGEDSVSGHFTLDFTDQSIGPFSFHTPLGPFDGPSGYLSTESNAAHPDLLDLYFESARGNNLWLDFSTELSDFGPFQPLLTDYSGISTYLIIIDCQPAGRNCNDSSKFFSSGFANGSATATLGKLTTFTPLPPAFLVFATGLGMMGLFGWRRKRKVEPA